MLLIKDLEKNYRKGSAEISVFRHLNLEVQPGEMVAVQGPSGCGKTTLLLIAGGLLHPSGGRVTFNQYDIYSIKAEERNEIRAQQFGFVFQQYHLIPYLSVMENILIPDLTEHSINHRKQAEKLIEGLGLTHRMAHIPAELSAGEKQRTALARALLHSPLLILADEITGNLDEQNAAMVMQTLRDYTDGGKMVLYVTHDSRATAFADQVLKIKNGSLTGYAERLV
jgi:putative ABC transport system ATP-binding protein